MTEKNNLEQLTRKEIEHYKGLQKEVRSHFMRIATAYPLILNIEYAYAAKYIESAKNNPEHAVSDNIFAATYGILFLATAINCILASIDNHYRVQEIKAIQKKTKPEQQN